MSLPMILAAGAALLILVTLLIVQRRRTATTAEDTDHATDSSGHTPPEDPGSHPVLATDQWRPLGLGARLTAILRGRRHGIQLLRAPGVGLYRAREGDAIRVVHEHDGVYGGRPRWTHVADLTRTMGKAERCWPGAELAGILSYTDSAVPVEYSPRLVADLEDETAPDPDGMSVA